jgi:hypothetical protein
VKVWFIAYHQIMFRQIFVVLTLFFTLSLYASVTSDIIEREFPPYYNLGAERYELYYCHKNVAALLNHLHLAGATLDEIRVVLMLDIEGQDGVNPSYTRFDSEFQWHVFFIHAGVIYDQNIMFGEYGLPVADYFQLMLGSKINLNRVVIRTVSGDIFHQFFYNIEGEYMGYLPHIFLERFIRGDEFPLESAQFLKWY